MLNDYSLSALLEFLDYLSEKGMVNKNTITSRKGACGKMLSILDSDEQSDLRDLDLEEVAIRFNNLEGQKYTPQSLQVYKSRVSTSLSDFLRYKENPASFKIAKPQPTKQSSNNSQSKRARPDAIQNSDESTVIQTTAKLRVQSIDVPIPIRENCIVQINGLPIDLTASEAKKISAVVNAMTAVDTE